MAHGFCFGFVWLFLVLFVFFGVGLSWSFCWVAYVFFGLGFCWTFLAFVVGFAGTSHLEKAQGLRFLAFLVFVILGFWIFLLPFGCIFLVLFRFFSPEKR